MRKSNNVIKSLLKKAKKDFRGSPIATIAFYGPTNKLSTKVAVGIIDYESAEPQITCWYSDSDIRMNTKIIKEVLNLIKINNV